MAVDLLQTNFIPTQFSRCDFRFKYLPTKSKQLSKIICSERRRTILATMAKIVSANCAVTEREFEPRIAAQVTYQLSAALIKDRFEHASFRRKFHAGSMEAFPSLFLGKCV